MALTISSARRSFRPMRKTAPVLRQVKAGTSSPLQQMPSTTGSAEDAAPDYNQCTEYWRNLQYVLCEYDTATRKVGCLAQEHEFLINQLEQLEGNITRYMREAIQRREQEQALQERLADAAAEPGATKQAIPMVLPPPPPQRPNNNGDRRRNQEFAREVVEFIRDVIDTVLGERQRQNAERELAQARAIAQRLLEIDQEMTQQEDQKEYLSGVLRDAENDGLYQQCGEYRSGIFNSQYCDRSNDCRGLTGWHSGALPAPQ